MLEDDSNHQITKINWYAQGSVFTLILVEIGWVVPWFEILVGASLGIPRLKTILVFGSLMAVAYVATLALYFFRIIRPIRLTIQVGILLLGVTVSASVFYGVPISEFIGDIIRLEFAAILTIFTVMWIWWRGITLALANIHPHVAWQRFRLGLIMIFFYSASLNWVSDETTDLGWFLFFLVVGFTSLVLARVAVIVDDRRGKNPFNRGWFATNLFFIVGVLAIAALISSLITGQFSILLDLISLAMRLVLAAIVFLVALPGILLASFLEPWIIRLRNQLAEAVLPTVESTEEPPASQLEIEPLELTGLLTWLPYLQSIVIWTIILVVLVLAVWSLSRLARKSRRVTIGEPESLIEPGDAGKLIRRALQQTVDDLFGRLWRNPRSLPEEQIRRIYIHLMDLFDELDHPRPETNTPLEFLPVMQSRLPSVAGELNAITAAYVRIRYGGIHETSEQVGDVTRAWQTVMQVGKREAKVMSAKPKVG